MLTRTANGSSRLSFWLRVREFAVPPSMIETATARRCAGDWAGACAAAGIDVDFQLGAVARSRGREAAVRLRADLRHLAPDLLRWHMPRIAPDGLLRPGLTIPLVRYDTEGRDGARPLYLVARTPPAWADGGQRFSLALWDGTDSEARTGRHPHPRPSRRFRLDLHRHLWDARRTDELRIRSGADRRPSDHSRTGTDPDPDPLGLVAAERRCAVDRWAAEVGILLRAEGRATVTATAAEAAPDTATGIANVRLGSRRWLRLELVADCRHRHDRLVERDGLGPPELRIAAAPADGDVHALPVLPDAATWVLPDLELLRAGSIEADRLHPLVASALLPGHAPAGPDRTAERPGQPRLVECRGAQHRIGLVDGVLAPLDHDPAEIRREELLVALTGTPLPCLRAIDEAHRHPDCLSGVRERLAHGDTAGALAVVEDLLGPGALLRDGPLRDELEAAAQRRLTYGLYRSGLVGPGPGPGRIDPGRPRP